MPLSAAKSRTPRITSRIDAPDLATSKPCGCPSGIRQSFSPYAVHISCEENIRQTNQPLIWLGGVGFSAAVLLAIGGLAP